MFKSSKLTVCLCVLLLVKSSRGFAREDDISYRHEFYREDDNRMSIDTDSAHFDVAAGSHVRLVGDLVLDAISGATPTGAPPQTQWPYKSFAQDVADYYNIVYNDPNNIILYNSGLFANYADYTNYVNANIPQLGPSATNYANVTRAGLTSNPNFYRNKVPVTDLHDTRRAASLGVPITFGIHTITPQLSISKESDYHSYGMALNYALQLNQKNTTLNAGWSHNADRVRDGNGDWQGKVSDDVLIGLNQLLTPKSYITFAFTYGQEYGYLSDPYRAVMFANDYQITPDDASLTLEVRPRRRTKEIFYTSFTQFIDPLNGSVELGYRFFHDSYGIFAHTAELAWHQKIGRNLVLTPSVRYYNQTAASFYAVIFPDINNKPQYFSSDYRLSELQTFNLSMNLNYRIHKYFAIDLNYSRYIMAGLDGLTSQSAYPSANVYSVGGRILF